MDCERTTAGFVDLARERMARTDQIVHAETRALLAYWERLRAGRVAPYRVEIDPRDMDCEAKRLFIVETRSDGAQRFRLAGSEVVDTFGMELRGLPTRTIMEGRARDSLTALIAETLEEPGIGYARLRPAGALDDDLWETLLLPLRSDGGRTDRLIGILRQLVGIQGRTRLLPLRFTLDEMWIQPIEITAEADPAPALPVAGMAEEQAGFAGVPAVPGGTRLTAIEGGRSASPQPVSLPRARPALRVIKDD